MAVFVIDWVLALFVFVVFLCGVESNIMTEKNWNILVSSLVRLLSPPQRLLLVNTRERNGSGSAGERKRERGVPSVARALLFSLFPASARRGCFFSQGVTVYVGDLCGGERYVCISCITRATFT